LLSDADADLDALDEGLRDADGDKEALGDKEAEGDNDGLLLGL
jgi:hypothetical protein